MNPNQPNIPPKPEPNSSAETDALDVIHVYIEAVGDTTIRPMRSPILRQIRPDQPPPPPPEKT